MAQMPGAEPPAGEEVLMQVDPGLWDRYRFCCRRRAHVHMLDGA
jgi:hypothetical protein